MSAKSERGYRFARVREEGEAISFFPVLRTSSLSFDGSIEDFLSDCV